MANREPIGVVGLSGSALLPRRQVTVRRALSGGEDEVLAVRSRARVTRGRSESVDAVGRGFRDGVARIAAGRALDGDDVVDAALGQRFRKAVVSP